MNTIDYNIMDEKEQDNTHLTFDNRKTIANMLNSKKPKYTLDDIGIAVGKTKSCIFKEIVNNGKIKSPKTRVGLPKYRQYHYYPKAAHEMYLKRLFSPKYISKYSFAIEWINQNIEHHKSLYHMQQEFKRSFPKEPCPSESTLYYYWKKGLIQYKSLRKPRKKRRNKEVWFKHTNKTSIECRPDIVNEKTEYGHYEIDMVMDGERKGGLVTFNEIKTKQYYALKVDNKSAMTVFKAILELIDQVGKENIKSITSDNGTEFAHHIRITNLFNIPWYFCHPFCSGERGLNEHLNGELRFFFPKGTSFFNKTQSEIDTIISKINNKYRKSLRGLSSNEVLDSIIN